MMQRQIRPLLFCGRWASTAPCTRTTASNPAQPSASRLALFSPLTCSRFGNITRQVSVIAQRTLRAFWEKHPKAEQPLRSWLQEMRRGSFPKPSDVRRHYRSADFVGDDRVIFNIGGNKYRLVAHMSYRRQIAFIKFIGTHKQYDRIDAATVGRVK